MLNNVVLDIFIGLVFIFLLYSLLATIIMEFVAHFMAMRPRMLLKALRRMLEDNPPEIFGRKKGWTLLDIWSDIRQSVIRFFVPFKDLSLLKRFYSHPSVKYLGESKSSSKPSYLNANNFSETMTQILRGDNYTGSVSQIEAIEDFLFRQAPVYLQKYREIIPLLGILPAIEEFQKLLADPTITMQDIRELFQRIKVFPVGKKNIGLRDQMLQHLESMIQQSEGKPEAFIRIFNERYGEILEIFHFRITRDTLKYLQNIYIDAQHDLDRFKQRLEMWFEDTMQRASGWYKRQTQWALLVIGFIIAAIGNVNTISIYKTLAKDKSAREQLVSLAVQSGENYGPVLEKIATKEVPDSTGTDSSGNTIVYKTRLVSPSDSVLQDARKMVMGDISQVEGILGMRWCNLPECNLCYQYAAMADSLKRTLPDSTEAQRKEKKEAIKTIRKQCSECFAKYKQPVTGSGILGWLLTAIAISLGAPFWFDILNKIMRLRSSGNKPASATVAPENTASNVITPVERKG